MNNPLSVDEILHSAATEASITVSLNDITNKLGVAEKVWGLYRTTFYDVITSVPWPFAVKREEMVKGESTGPGSPWNNFYDFPADVLQPWNIYPSGFAGFLDLPSAVPIPLTDRVLYTPGSKAGFAEIIGGRVASNVDVSVFYVVSTEIDVKNWSQPFIKSLKATLRKRLLASRDMDADSLAIQTRFASEEEREGKTTEAIANKNAYRIPQATIITNVFSER